MLEQVSPSGSFWSDIRLDQNDHLLQLYRLTHMVQFMAEIYELVSVYGPGDYY